MKTDRELLEMAAKAAGVKGYYCENIGIKRSDLSFWNPLWYNGEALELAVRLHFGLKDFPPHDISDLEGDLPAFGMIEVWRESDDDPLYVEWYKPGDDRYKATRRAIVRAAAAIGETK